MQPRFRFVTVLCLLGLWLFVPTARAGFFDFLRSDLEFRLLVETTEGLAVGDPVAFEDGDGRRETVGRIAAIPDDRGGAPVVTVRVDAEHKDRVRAGSRVIVDRPLVGEEKARVYIVTPPEQAESPPLRSGAVVVARSAVAEKAEQVMGQVQSFIESLLGRSRRYLERLRQEIDRGEVDRFMERLRETARTVGGYTRAQKERFEREVLPELERLMEEARHRFEELKEPRRGEELEREFLRLKEELAV